MYQEIDINKSGGIDEDEFLGWVFQTNNFRSWLSCQMWNTSLVRRRTVLTDAVRNRMHVALLAVCCGSILQTDKV